MPRVSSALFALADVSGLLLIHRFPVRPITTVYLIGVGSIIMTVQRNANLQIDLAMSGYKIIFLMLSFLHHKAKWVRHWNSFFHVGISSLQDVLQQDVVPIWAEQEVVSHIHFRQFIAKWPAFCWLLATCRAWRCMGGRWAAVVWSAWWAATAWATRWSRTPPLTGWTAAGVCRWAGESSPAPG